MMKNFHLWAKENMDGLMYSYNYILPKYIKSSEVFVIPSFQDWCVFLYEHSNVNVVSLSY